MGKLLRLEKADAAMDNPELHPSMAGHANPKLNPKLFQATCLKASVVLFALFLGYLGVGA